MLWRWTGGIDLSAWSDEFDWLYRELVELGDVDAIKAFLSHNPGPMGRWPLPSLATLDRPAAELLATRIVAEDVLTSWTLQLLAEAGFPDAVRTAVRDLAVPQQDTEEFISVLVVLYDNGFPDEVRRLLTAGLPDPAGPRRATDLIHVLNGLGRRDEVLALVSRINGNERMLEPSLWSGFLRSRPAMPVCSGRA